MAHSTLLMMNPLTKYTKKAPIGFSWTAFLFGFFPPFIRGDWKWGFISLGLCVITGGLFGIVFGFIYNKIYAKELLAAGWVVTGSMGQPLETIALQLGVQLPVAVQ